MKWLTLVSMQSKGIKFLTQNIIELQKPSQEIHFSSKIVQTYHIKANFPTTAQKTNLLMSFFSSDEIRLHSNVFR